ncbi:RHS domain-containing protein [Variovorax sp. ZS18.2.2]|uniref:RHS repeat-associated core domain-containing protein n=1 Tax=Variovorax sp. ZS18.2.2 TaxID=2971255 RepID=UPI002150F0F5|nr:RHS repeat-associated core domain-containing protein [Variovorax sp. ZS18.2.2]MCR6480208.1 RHS domain-containing protein [Variovorax sp. ZS18.2.2]
MKIASVVWGKAHRAWGTAGFAAMLAMGVAVSALAQVTVAPPNGTLSADVVDLSVQTSAGPVEWKRSFNGTGWRFNRHWDGISASYKPVMTQNTGGGAPGMSDGSQGSAPSTCWIWVDEDWQPGDGVTVPAGGSTPALAVPPETYLPANRSYNQTAVALDTVITTGFASGCASIGGNPVGNSSEVIEGYRRQSTLYVGAGGTYIFKNRFTLQKQPIQKLAPVALPIVGGSVSFVGLTSVASGWRWSDRAGDWAEYDDDGRISRYGDKNNNTVWLQRNAAGQIVRIVDGGAGGVSTSGNVIITLHYDAKGYLEKVKDWPPAGSNSLDVPQRTVTYIYDTQGRMTGVTDVRGNTTAYAYDGKQRLTKTTDPRGGETKLTYDTEGTSVKSVTAADGGVTDYSSSWDSTKKLFYSKVQGPATTAGRRVEDYSHDRAGDLVKYEVNGRMETEIKRDPSARTETQTNARGFATTYTRNEFEQITQIQYPDGAKVSTAYDAKSFNPVEETDELGVKTRYEYDPKGNLTKKIEAVGLAEQRATEYERDGAGRPSSITVKGRLEANGSLTPDATWQLVYDAAGQISQTIDPEGGRRSYVYNRLGKLAKYTDPLGNASSYETDAKGNLIKVTNALGHVRSFDYDKNNNPISSTDAKGKAIQAAYDAMNRRIQTTNEVGGQQKRTYDKQGLQVGQTDEDGRATVIGYDTFRRITSGTDALANVTSYGYQIIDGTAAGGLGSLGAPTEIQYPTFKKQIKYDSRERPTSETVLNPGAGGTQTTTNGKTYDAKGQLIGEQDANGKTRSYRYDALGQRVETTNALGAKTQIAYDSRGNLIQLTDAKGNVTKFVYDRANRLTTETLPLGQSTTYRYDDAGNLSERTDPAGTKKQYIYDAANRITKVQQIKAGSVIRIVSFTWDADNHLTGWSDTDATRPIGQQTTTATLGYDDAGRKIRETVSYPNPAGESYALSYGYEYSLAGKKTQLNWADGSAIDYGYSQHGELETVKIPGEGTISVNQFKWIAPAKITLPGGGTQEKTWDGLLNLKDLKARTPGQQTVLSLTNTYGKFQEIQSAKRSDSASGLSRTQDASYSYDDELRLTQVKSNSGGLLTDTETFVLDALANRTSHSTTGDGAWKYDANNRLLQRPNTNGASLVSYEYDANGNQVKKIEATRTTNFIYDSDNRLIEVRDGSKNLVARYGYDPMSRRTWKEQHRDRAGNLLSQARRIYFLYSDEGLIAEATQSISLSTDGSVNAIDAPAITTQYGPRPDSEFTTGTLFIKTRNTNNQDAVAYYQHNHLETPIQANDKAGNVLWAASYNAFGQVAVITPAATQENPIVISNLRLPGQYFDEETGLHYNWFRSYDPLQGRYISSDPLGVGAGLNFFNYAASNPLIAYDPTGLRTLKGPCIENILGPKRYRNYDLTEEDVLFTLYKPGVIVKGVQFGPDIDPRSPKNKPIKPGLDAYFVIDEYEYYRQTVYNMTDVYQKFVVACTWIEECGREEKTFVEREEKIETIQTLKSISGIKERFVERIIEISNPF